MGLWDSLPYTNFHELNADWLLQAMKDLENRVQNFIAVNQLQYSGVWSIAKQYPAWSVVTWNNAVYVSLKPVVSGVDIGNTEFWLKASELDPAIGQLGARVGALENSVAGIDAVIGVHTAELETLKKRMGVAVDVTAFGAKGDGVTDDSAAVSRAYAESDILYFPAGTYRFKNVQFADNVQLLGDGAVLRPISKTGNSNQAWPMFTCYGKTALISGFGVTGVGISSEYGEKFIQESYFKFLNCERVEFKNCRFFDIFQSYHLSVGTVPFNERNGIMLFCQDCDSVTIDNCDFGEFGGEELIWISRKEKPLGSGYIRFGNNYFHDRYSELTGSCANVYGGIIEFAGNMAKNYNNTYTVGGAIIGGSIFNLLGDVVNVHDNVFNDCNSNGFIDCCEGYYFKNNNVTFSDNVFTGTAYRSVKAFARNFRMENCVIDGSSPVMLFTANSAPTTGVPACATPDSVYVFDNVEIVNCKFNCAGLTDITNYINYGVSIGQSQDMPSRRAVIGNVTIDGCEFRHVSGPEFMYILFFSGVDRATVKNNVFNGAGTSTPSSSRKAIISFIAPSGATITAKNNLILPGALLDADYVNMVTTSTGGVNTMYSLYNASEFGENRTYNAVLVGTLVENYNHNFRI